MAISIFETRTMLAMLEKMFPPKTFLRDTFFGNVVTFDTEHVDIDIKKGNRKMAPFVHPRIGSKTVDKTGYETKSYKPLPVAPDTITTAENLLKRMAGETLYGQMSPDQRASQQLAMDLAELDDMITRREEWMCAQALFAGEIAMVGEGISETLNFGHTNREALGAGSRWNEATADIFGDFRRWGLACRKGSGYNPTTAVLGSDAAAAFLGNEAVQKRLDLRRVDMGMINPQVLPNGVTYLGYLNDPGVDLYQYDEWYYDEASGEDKPMVPTKQVMLGNPNARMDRLYGAVVDVDMGTFALPRVPKSWTTPKPSARFVQIIAKPLPVPHDLDSFYVATVLA